MIYQYTLEGELVNGFENLKEASEQTDTSYTSISKCINGLDGRKTAGGYVWVEELVSNKNINKKVPKILLFDLETSPTRSYTFGLWKQNIGINQIISDWFCLSWSAKWLFSDSVMSNRLTGKEAIEEDDKRIITNLHSLICEADIIIAHNAIGFDVPRMNARFILNGLPPTSPYQIIDTLKVAQKEFGFSSNKLDHLCKLFGIQCKLETSFELWKGCMNGDEKSLMYMEQYNRHDVEMLEELYIKLRPWIKGHPNLALYTEAEEYACPNCGGTDLKENGFYYTQTGKYQAFSCSCGTVSRLRRPRLQLKPENLLKQSIAK